MACRRLIAAADAVAGADPGLASALLSGQGYCDVLVRGAATQLWQGQTVTSTCRLLLVSGSLRSASTNTAVLRTAVSVVPLGCSATVFDGLARLPHFNPDDDTEPLDPAVVELRSTVDAADGLLLSTPEYAGALPGSFKNLLDWLVGGVEISRKPTGWINASSSPTGAAGAHASLRRVLGYVDAEIVDGACAHIPVRHDAIGSDGTIIEPALRTQIAGIVEALVGACGTGAR